jgi:hypothetical protein
MPIWYYYGHLAYFVSIWHILSHFGMKYQGKSGNPGPTDFLAYPTPSSSWVHEQAYSRFRLKKTLV